MTQREREKESRQTGRKRETDRPIGRQADREIEVMQRQTDKKTKTHAKNKDIIQKRRVQMHHL